MFLRCIRVFREETLEPICCIFFFFEGGVVTPTKILTIIFTAYKKSKYMLSIIKK